MDTLRGVPGSCVLEKELERVSQGVAIKVREFIRKEYTSMGKRAGAKGKVSAHQVPVSDGLGVMSVTKRGLFQSSLPQAV